MKKWNDNGCPEHSLHTTSCQIRMSARHQRKIFAAPIGTATPNAVYTQQAAKPACQQDISAKFSQLLLAQLPRTQFTHSKAPNPNVSKTSAQNFRSSYWHGYPERHSHTASPRTRMPAIHQRKLFAAPIGRATPNDVYTQQAAKPRMARTHQDKIFASSIVTASIQKFRSSYITAATQICHTDTSSANVNITAATQICHTAASANANRTTATQICHADTSSANANITTATKTPPLQTPIQLRRQAGQGPAATPRAADSSMRLWILRLPHRAAGAQRRRRAPQTLLAALDIAPATRSHAAQRRHRAPQTLLAALDTAPATQHRRGPARCRRTPQTLSRGFEYCACHTDSHRRPAATTRAATLSRRSEYCACHRDRSRGPAATRRAATLSGRSEYCACHTDSSRGPAATRRAATLSGRSEYCACHTDRSRGPAATRRATTLSRGSATQTETGAQRRPGAPQPFLEALSIAPATQTEARKDVR